MIEEERLSEDAELLVEPAEDGPHPDDRIDDERHDEENRLKPEYVRAVLDALEAGDKSAVYDLVEPLHPADIADLLELSARHARARLAAAITDPMGREWIATPTAPRPAAMVGGLGPATPPPLTNQTETEHRT